jgi:hypothetical protein
MTMNLGSGRPKGEYMYLCGVDVDVPGGEQVSDLMSLNKPFMEHGQPHASTDFNP